MANYLTNDTELQSVANAIREKGGTSAPLVYPTGFVNAISAIEIGVDTSDANATADDILSGKTAYVDGQKITGNIPSQGTQTITPGTTNQTITAGKYLTGAQTIAGDSNLVAANIAEGVSIFGVTGTHSGGGGAEDGIIARTISGVYENSRLKKIGTYAFYRCTTLTSVSFPACTEIGMHAFESCTALTSVSFPACISIYASAFYSCTALTSVSFPACISIYASAFRYCYNLTSLYLTASSYVSLSNSTAFMSTPIGGYSTSAGRYGSIYVPASMLASYKTRTNWTYYSSRMVGI